MRQGPVVGMLVPAIAASAAADGAATLAAKPFSAYASCGIKAKHGDRFCFTGDRPVAVYRAFGRADVAYRVCARKRGARKHCEDRRSESPGQRSRTRIDRDGPGTYKLAWFEDGHAVDRDKPVVRERAVFLVGDSLSQGIKPYLPRALPDWKLDHSLSISRHAPEGVSILRRRGGLPGAVVFALGTNDDPRAVWSFRNSLRSALSLVGKTRCLVVPNIVRPPVGGASCAGYNRVIAALGQPAEGYQARARAIAKQVERC